SRLRMLANHGMNRRYFHDEIGVNSRLDSLQASILNVKLPHLNKWNQARISAANAYDSQLRDLNEVQTSVRANWSQHVFHQYTLRIRDGRRDELQQWLLQHNVPSMVYYPVPMHEQNAFTKAIRR